MYTTNKFGNENKHLPLHNILVKIVQGAWWFDIDGKKTHTMKATRSNQNALLLRCVVSAFGGVRAKIPDMDL